MLASSCVHSHEHHEDMTLHTKLHSVHKSRVHVTVGTVDPVHSWNSPALSIWNVLLGTKYFFLY